MQLTRRFNWTDWLECPFCKSNVINVSHMVVSLQLASSGLSLLTVGIDSLRIHLLIRVLQMVVNQSQNHVSPADIERKVASDRRHLWPSPSFWGFKGSVRRSTMNVQSCQAISLKSETNGNCKWYTSRVNGVINVNTTSSVQMDWGKATVKPVTSQGGVVNPKVSWSSTANHLYCLQRMRLCMEASK